MDKQMVQADACAVGDQRRWHTYSHAWHPSWSLDPDGDREHHSLHT